MSSVDTVTIFNLIKIISKPREIIILSSTCKYFRYLMDIYEYFRYDIYMCVIKVSIEISESDIIYKIHLPSSRYINHKSYNIIQRYKSKEQCRNNSELFYMIKNTKMSDDDIFETIKGNPSSSIHIFQYQTLSEKLIRSLFSKFKLELYQLSYYIIKYQSVSEQLYLDYLEYFNTQLVLYNNLLSEKSLEMLIDNDTERYTQYAIIDLIIVNSKVSEEFIIKHIAEINLNLLLEYQRLSEDFIEEYIDILNIDKILKYQQLSMNFIKKYIYDLLFYSINKICRYQNLSEDFMREYKDDLNWRYISKYQKISKSFIIEFHEYLDLYDVYMNDNIKMKNIVTYL